MTTNKILKLTILCFVLAMGTTFTSCGDEDCNGAVWYADTDNDGLGDPNVSKTSCDQPEGYVANNDDDSDFLGPINSKFLIGAEVGEEGYFLTTDNLTSGAISIVGNGNEGYANLSASVDGFFYYLNSNEGTLDKMEFTTDGLVKRDAISTTALLPGSFYRYIQDTGNGDLFLSNFPNENGDAPFAIIDLATFTVEKHGFFNMPDVDGKKALWANGLVKDDKIYFGSYYGNLNRTGLAQSLITIKFDYPSITNPVVLKNDASAGNNGGYRTNGAFKTENGDIYQYNLNSIHWYGHDELAEKPTVFVRIKDGDYDDYVFDISSKFTEPIAIWNAWYAGNNIVYANVVREADIAVWRDLSGNNGTLVEINLETKTVTELNIPKATYVNIFSLNCVENGNFYIPVNVNGGDANIYKITIGGGANGFEKGAALDGNNVFVNSLHRNF
ncbi:hypothetical protein SAMN04489761_2456 [Tenacibaculum sp. MAR_2009_124]|uniref:hypothetical protein n=1 Tax=Tenacibaculum sp. MAR_2009_124 TaxID=1250059 RepID=UPI000898D142|nr:hypothetical protein [Tenacibaculum sp. MAR_2009_124]SEC23869.1 hypothetical protein SAMN04489761_2456 [Tenacibaculum sp. MAR_2009_124]